MVVDFVVVAVVIAVVVVFFQFFGERRALIKWRLKLDLFEKTHSRDGAKNLKLLFT